MGRKAAATTEDLREQVRKLRDEERLSFSQVAKKLAISKAYAVKLANTEGNGSRSTKQGTGHSKLSIRERHFAAGLLEGKTQREAALDAVPPGALTEGSADSWANRTLGSARFQDEFTKLLDRAGLSDERLAQVHAENLGATKVVATVQRKGKITDIVEHPDHQVRQRAVADGWRLRGRMQGNQEQERPPSQPIIIMEGSPMEKMLMGTVWRGKGPPESVRNSVKIQRGDGEIIDITPAAAGQEKPGESVVPPAGESRAPEALESVTGSVAATQSGV
jgi:hypothetical protein